MLPASRLPLGRTLTVSAPAKLNLRLKVEGRRADGYHLLSMLNVTTDLVDRITLRPSWREHSRLTVVGSDEPAAASTAARAADGGVPTEWNDNLASRAVSAFFAAFDISCGAEVRIEKRIPLGAGLAGGSSDAAAVLRALRAFAFDTLQHTLRVPAAEIDERVSRVALSLGADVPFFLRHGSPGLGGFAWVGGIGEELRPLPARFVSGIQVLLVLPRVSLSTPAVYARLRETEAVHQEDRKGRAFAAYVEALDGRRSAADHDNDPGGSEFYQRLLDVIDNDLLGAARGIEPLVGSILDRLHGVPGLLPSLTGSGSAIFAFNRDGRTIDARQIAAARRAVAADTSLMRTLEISPTA